MATALGPPGVSHMSLIRNTVCRLAAFVVALVASGQPAFAAPDRAVIGVIEIEGSVPARRAAAGLGGMGKGGNTLREYTTALDQAAGDADLAGVLIKLKDAELKTSQVEELGAAIQRVRAAGKKVHLYSYFYRTPELMLGSYTDDVIAQAGSAVSLPGIYMEEMYLADTLAWAGVKADFVQVGDYKGAAETMMNARPSPEWNQNIDQLLDGMYGVIRARLKAGRKMDDARLDSAMEVAWEALAEDARKAGLIDTVLDLPDLDAHLGTLYGKKVEWRDDLMDAGAGPSIDTSNPFALFSMLMNKEERKPKRSTIAVVHIDGPIVDGDSESGGFLGGGASVGSLTIRRALSEIEENALIKGLVIRIDSPGGSAVASEVIWKGVRRVAAAGKPVWVSVGSMAASGGYYIAVAGDKVYVTPSSIVGSIGVVGGKMSLGGLYEKFNVNTVGRGRGPRAAMAASATGWSAAEKALVREKMVQVYDLFAGRVTAGRKGIDLKQTAEGRLFVGEKAIALKMADNLGGLDTALSDMAAGLNLAEGSFDVFDYPAPKGFEEMLEDMLGGFGMSAAAPALTRDGAGAAGPFAAMLGEAVGPGPSATILSSARSLLQMHKEPVLLVSPRVLIFR
ncbi:MAG: S49 family peptidase [Phycisphaerales bacterium]